MQKKVPIQSLKAKKVIDGDLFLTEEPIFAVLPANNSIPTSLIECLQKWQIDSVYTNGSGDMLAPPNKEEKTKYFTEHEIEEIQYVKQLYANLVEQTQEIIHIYLTKEQLMIPKLVEILLTIIQALQEKRRYFVQLSLYEGLSDSYFINHALQTTILSLLIGQKVKLVQHKLLELGIAAYLHEIGLLHVPRELHDKAAPMSVEERRLVSSHVLIGYRNLKTFSLAQDVLLGILQHHEYLDGTGYLQNLTGDKICFYAKIISIACAYHAQISNRPHRPAKTGNASLLSLLKYAGQRYDKTLVSALITALSLYPIGSYVRLSDGSVAYVIDTNGNKIRFPIVKILIGPQGKKVAARYAVVRLNEQYFIKEALSAQEVQKIIKKE